MMKTLFLVAIAIGMSVIGQLCLKVGMTQVGRVGMEQLMFPVEVIFKVVTTPLIVLAVLVYIIDFGIWLIVLSRANLSFVYPLLSATYILVPLAAYFLLSESINPQQWAGIFVITVGVLLVAGSRVHV
ncbi:MAG: multidrug resistance protein [Nitrospiraceae bacterium]|nr:multidrug resistance protein [Nitrospiraceae bacterium]|tara:strand:+ start:837 stop:1220 length:384 start_codon:yes stop_codon:yes gene_type:complete